jgi:hypothetical protein
MSIYAPPAPIAAAAHTGTSYPKTLNFDCRKSVSELPVAGGGVVDPLDELELDELELEPAPDPDPAAAAAAAAGATVKFKTCAGVLPTVHNSDQLPAVPAGNIVLTTS